jgi:hypothetical protein
MMNPEIQEAKPFVRSVVALLFALRLGLFNDNGVEQAYKIADKFWSKFEEDLKK